MDSFSSSASASTLETSAVFAASSLAIFPLFLLLHPIEGVFDRSKGREINHLQQKTSERECHTSEWQNAS